MDIAVANSTSNCIGIFLGYDNYSFTNQTTYDTIFGSLPRSIAVGDFNKDNDLDIVVANCGNDNVSVLLGVDNGSFQTKRHLQLDLIRSNTRLLLMISTTIHSLTSLLLIMVLTRLSCLLVMGMGHLQISL